MMVTEIVQISSWLTRPSAATPPSAAALAGCFHCSAHTEIATYTCSIALAFARQVLPTAIGMLGGLFHYAAWANQSAQPEKYIQETARPQS